MKITFYKSKLGQILPFHFEHSAFIKSPFYIFPYFWNGLVSSSIQEDITHPLAHFKSVKNAIRIFFPMTVTSEFHFCIEDLRTAFHWASKSKQPACKVLRVWTKNEENL